MKELFYIWITIQLLIIGMTTVEIYNDVLDGTYQCNNRQSEPTPLIAGIIIPLVAFVPEPPSIRDYCQNQKIINDQVKGSSK